MGKEIVAEAAIVKDGKACVVNGAAVTDPSCVCGGEETCVNCPCCSNGRLTARPGAAATQGPAPFTTSISVVNTDTTGQPVLNFAGSDSQAFTNMCSLANPFGGATGPFVPTNLPGSTYSIGSAWTIQGGSPANALSQFMVTVSVSTGFTASARWTLRASGVSWAIIVPTAQSTNTVPSSVTSGGGSTVEVAGSLTAGAAGSPMQWTVFRRTTFSNGRITTTTFSGLFTLNVPILRCPAVLIDADPFERRGSIFIPRPRNPALARLATRGRALVVAPR